MSAATMSLTSANEFIVILLSVAVVQGQNKWRVTYTSTQICALQRATVHMSCTYTTPVDARVDKTFWFVTSGDIFTDLKTDPYYSNRVQYSCNAEKNCSLRISNLRTKDSALYKFRITTTHPREKWYGYPGINLSVTDRPDLQVHVSRPSRCSGDTCVPAKLRCESTCHLPDDCRYTWFKNKTKLLNEISSFYSTDNISPEDKISCAVEGYESFPSPSVYAPSVPTVTSNYSGEISEGSSVTLTCNSKANPPVTKYTWYKKNRNADQQPVSAMKQLVFVSIQSSDSGEYYCKAENQLRERASKYILVNVKSSSTSIAVGVTVAILLLIILITIFFLFRGKRASKKSAEVAVDPQSSEKRPPSPKPPTGQDNLHYATVDFSQNQANPVYSNSGAARHQNPQNKPTFSEYSAVAFHNNSSDHRSRVQESAEAPSVM